MLDGQLRWHWAAEYTLARELNGKVLHSVTAKGFKDALEALRSMAIEDETVMWLCTCACSDKTHEMIDVALAGTRLGRWEPKH
jgi:hypothetical protein